MTSPPPIISEPSWCASTSSADSKNSSSSKGKNGSRVVKDVWDRIQKGAAAIFTCGKVTDMVTKEEDI